MPGNVKIIGLGLGVGSQLPTQRPEPAPKKRSWFLVKVLILFVLLAVLVHLFERKAGAEEPAQTASEILATTARPTTVLFGDVVSCLKEANLIFKNSDKAAKFCLNARDKEKERAKNAAKHASNAIRPVPVYGYGSYGYGGYGYGYGPGGYGYSSGYGYGSSAPYGGGGAYGTNRVYGTHQ